VSVAGEQPQHYETGRVEAFSDGVFAIAITLLVLEIRVEDYDDLRSSLLHEWPAYLAYITSFTTVGSVWIAHHNLFGQLRYVDPVLLRLNLILLLFAAFLPFPTGVLAQSFHESADAERTAVVFYGAIALIIELLLRSSIRYAVSKPELHVENVPQMAFPLHSKSHGWRAAVSSAAYGLAIIFGAFVFPRVAAIAYLLVALRGVLVVGGEGRLSLSSRRKSDSTHA
jgi:uncharacterized membrane protein